MTIEAPHPFSALDFARQDESDDSLFYVMPRMVVHIDDPAIAVVGDLFREMIPPDSVVLDLMSSWRSHWPDGHPKTRIVGLGLNAAEMQDNPDLDDLVIHDVNKDPHLPFDDSMFDAVAIAVSIQYVTRPIEVFQDVNRVLKPGGLFAVIFSNRMFPTKAVRVWMMGNDQERATIVASYFHFAGNYEGMNATCRNPDRGYMEDPVYVVMARKVSD